MSNIYKEMNNHNKKLSNVSEMERTKNWWSAEFLRTTNAKTTQRLGQPTKRFYNWVKTQIQEGKLITNFLDPNDLFNMVGGEGGKGGWGAYKSYHDKRSKARLKKRYRQRGLRRIGSVIADVPALKQRYIADLQRFKNEKRTTMSLAVAALSPEERIMEILTRLGGGGNRITLKYTTLNGEEKHITLNESNRARLLHKLRGEEDEYVFYEEDRELEFIENLRISGNIELVENHLARLHKEGKKLMSNKKDGGKFFPYYSKLLKLNLEKYGVFTAKGDEERYSINCLHRALIASGVVNKNILKNLGLQFKTRIFPIKDLDALAIRCGIRIHLNRQEKSHKLSYIKYPKKEYDIKKPLVELGLLKGHYFLNEKVHITKHAVENYFDIKDDENYNYLATDGTHKFTNPRWVMSFKLIKILLEKKTTHLKKIPFQDLGSTQFIDKFIDFDDLDYDDECLREVKYKEKTNKRAKYFFDFEADPTGHRHIPFHCSILNHTKYLRLKKKYVKIWGEKKGHDEAVNLSTISYFDKYIPGDCAAQMLAGIGEDCLLIAHNAGYDWRWLLPYISVMGNPTLRGNGLISVSARCYYGKRNYEYNKKRDKMVNQGIKITIHDSWKKIPMKLADFAKAFGLEEAKEVYPYDLYTEKNRKKGMVAIKEGIKILREKGSTNDDLNAFEDNIKKWDLADDEGRFDIMGYARIYCRRDCEVLMLGYECWRKDMLEVTGIDIDTTVSVPQLAHKYFMKEGCYENVYEMSGLVREFHQRCVIGGKCMTRDNKPYSINKKFLKGDGIANIDQNSQYPNAFYQMLGLLMGKPKVLKQLNKKFLDTVDGYFIKIKILKVGKTRHFPSLMRKINGINCYTNEMENQIMYMDKVGLEDLIKYHQIKYEIIQGYYYNEGRNPKIKKLIKKLYDKRLVLKEEGNKMELCIKLLLNSGYGRTILKPIDEEIVIKRDNEYEKYQNRQYNYIKEFYPITNTLKKNKRWIFKLYKPTNEHFNMAQVGVEVLSMAKRGMNELMYLAEDLGIPMWIMDTDSCHLLGSRVPELEKEYEKRFGNKLIGKNLGQFSSDFKMKGCKSDTIICSEGFYLMKKTYIERLEGKDKDGITIHGFHYRMKGIPQTTIKYYIHQRKKHNPHYDVWKMYQELYDGKTLHFDLLEGGHKSRFVHYKDLSIGMIRQKGVVIGRDRFNEPIKSKGFIRKVELATKKKFKKELKNTLKKIKKNELKNTIIKVR